MQRMLDRGEGSPLWRPGLVMFERWLAVQVIEAEGLPTEAERADTPALEPSTPAPGDTE